MSEEELDLIVKDMIGEDEKVLMATGLEDAFMGIGRQFTNPPFAVYDRTKCIEILMRDGMDAEEAEEYFQFNVEGAWMGENTPVFVESLQYMKEMENYEL